MLVGISILVIAALIFGIVYINSSSVHKKKTREEYLQDLANFLEGKVEPIVDRENSHKIEFNFEGYPFLYEDVQTYYLYHM